MTPSAPQTPLRTPPAAVALRLAAAALLLWLGAAFVFEADAFRRQAAAPPSPEAVALWRLGTPRADSMGPVLADFEPYLADGAVVVFTSGSGVPSREFFLTRWAAYYLPRQRVIGLSHPRAAARGDDLVAYGPRPAPRQIAGAGAPAGTAMRPTAVRREVAPEVARNYGAVLYRLSPAPAAAAKGDGEDPGDSEDGDGADGGSADGGGGVP